jgi:hypothetical protein
MTLEQRAGNFTQRYEAQRAFERDSISQGKESSRWILIGGDYSLNQIIRGHHPVDTFRGPRFRKITLSGYEVFLRDQMQEALKTSNENKPTIFLDLGGGAGESWAKLAIYFRNEIARGQAVFAVSNLVFKPEQYYPYFNLASEVNPNVSFALSNGLVQYIEGPFVDIPTKEISLPNGETMKLERNVSLVNEDKSLTNWTQIPEEDIPNTVGQLLSKQGIYLVNSDDYTKTPTADTPEARKDILDGKQLAYDILQRDYDLQIVRTAEEGKLSGQKLEYLVTRKPLAPAIVVN